MPSCKQMTERATDFAEGHLGLLDRLRHRLHLATCGHCRAYVRQLRAAILALGRLPDPEISPELSAALLGRFDAWAASRSGERGALPAPARQQVLAGARRRALLPMLAVLAAPALLLALARSPSRSPDDWVVASVLAAAALAMAAVAGRFALGVVAAAVSAALAAALAGGGSGPFAAATGIECLAAEIGSAAVVAGAAWLAALGGPAAGARRVLAASAAAGALAGDAALQVACGARDALPHLLAFHVGGVLVVAAAALLVIRGWRPLTPSRGPG